METYEMMYQESLKTKNVKQLTAVYKKFEKVGDFVLGAFVARSSVSSSLGGGEYYQYLFETDDGLIKFALGKSGDGEIGAVLREGGIYRIEFKGQEDLTGGRRVNKFECLEIGFQDVIVPTPNINKENGKQDDKK